MTPDEIRRAAFDEAIEVVDHAIAKRAGDDDRDSLLEKCGLMLAADRLRAARDATMDGTFSGTLSAGPGGEDPGVRLPKGGESGRSDAEQAAHDEAYDAAERAKRGRVRPYMSEAGVDEDCKHRALVPSGETYACAACGKTDVPYPIVVVQSDYERGVRDAWGAVQSKHGFADDGPTGDLVFALLARQIGG